MLIPPHNHLSYFTATSSVARATGTQNGTTVTGNATANTYGSWTQIHAGLTYPSEYILLNLNTLETSGDVINATTRNAYVDIGYGADTSNVVVACEKICGSHASLMGRSYFLPVRLPPDKVIYARLQTELTSGKIGVNLMTFGGNMNPGSFPNFPQIVCLGATTANTTGTSITPGNTAAEGSWTTVVASTTDDYGGLMIGGMFQQDTTMTGLSMTTMDVAIGASGQERTVGENITMQAVYSSNEEVISFSIPTFVGIKAGSRISVRASGSGTADTSSSVVVYAFKH